MSLPYFAMYPSNFEAKTSHLSLEEDGAYNRLLRLMWMTPGCSLPDDDAWIMRRMRCDTATFERVVSPIIAEFMARKGGRVLSPRLTEEWQKADETYRLRSKAGKKGGRPQATDKKEKEQKAGLSQPKGGPKQLELEPEQDLSKREAKASQSVADQDECFQHFNKTADFAGWSKVKERTPQRRAALSQRINSVGGVDQWCEAINRAAMSPLLTGQAGSGWRADFDWLAKPSNFTKLMEGNYDDRKSPGNHNGQGARPGPHNALMAGFAMAADRLKN